MLSVNLWDSLGLGAYYVGVTSSQFPDLFPLIDGDFVLAYDYSIRDWVLMIKALLGLMFIHTHIHLSQWLKTNLLLMLQLEAPTSLRLLPLLLLKYTAEGVAEEAVEDAPLVEQAV